uniref:Shikimate dehydrogenase n=1 Tax=Leersia perrieri TaxID=77586 RepID=A0A0D9V145_9ORYZ
MTTLLCVPLVTRTVEAMLADAAAAAAAGADLVEIRLDFIEGFRPREHLPLLLRGCPIPALATYRPNWEGGQYEGDDITRFEALRLAMELGIDYVDIELKFSIFLEMNDLSMEMWHDCVHNNFENEFSVADKFISFISGSKPEKCKLIVSSHNYESTPSCEELADLVARIQAVGADIVKIATTARDIVDVSRMFQVMVHCQVSAPGQPTVEELLDIYNIRRIGPDTKVLGLIANPVKQSKSPILHNKCLQSVGYNAVYLPLLADDLARFLSTYSSPDFSGFSCSLPFKVDAVQCCHEHDPIAKSIGAINTIIRRPDGKLVGYNTDYIGAISAIEDGIGGAGGAGKAIAYGAKEKGARVVVANRTYEKAVNLAAAVGGRALRLAELETFRPEQGMILANATSLGMYPNVDGTPIPKKALSFYDVVFDAVYAPKVTRLLQEAEECGVKVVSGVEMFIRQAMGQFERFTGGIEAPESLMREIAAKYT